MLFKDVKHNEFFYFSGHLFIKKDDLHEACIPVSGQDRNATYMDGQLIGYPCRFSDYTIVSLANAVIAHSKKQTFSDIPVNTAFIHDGQSWFKLNDKMAIPSKNVNGILEFDKSVLVTV